MSVKALRNQLLAAIAMVLVAALALGSSTFAWFVTNSTVTAEGAEVEASTAYSLLISRDKTNWKTEEALNDGDGLSPVSTIGVKLTDGKTDMFNYNATDADKAADKGDIRFVASNAWDQNLVINYNEVGKNSKIAANTHYYYTDTVYFKAAQASSLALDSAQTGIVWTEQDGTTKTFYTFDKFVATSAEGGPATHATDTAYNTELARAQALVKTLRVGLQMTKITSATTADAIATERAADTSKFFVYQLSANTLTNPTLTTKQGSADGITKAIGPASSDSNTIVASGVTENLNTADNNTLNFANGASVPVITTKMTTGVNNALATLGTADNLGDFVANDIYQCDVYIWMEGCDYDVAAANLEQFTKGEIPAFRFGFCLATTPTP